MDKTDLTKEAIPKDSIKKFDDIDEETNGWEKICLFNTIDCFNFSQIEF